MSVIRSLAVELKAQTESFNNSIRGANRELKEIQKEIKPTKDLFKDMGTVATAAGLAIVGGLAAAVKASADYGDKINDAAKRTGIATETLSKLNLAAETSGTSFEGLTTGLKFLAKNMELANSGSKEQIDAFRAAGISSKDLANAHGDVNSILNKLSDTFAASEDGAGKTALSMKLLGKSGSDLIPLLNEGSAGLKKWGDEAERAGRVVSAEAARAADEFNDRLAVLHRSIDGLTGTIGASMIPSLTKWVEEGTKVVQQVKDWTAANKDLANQLAGIGLVLTGAGGILLSSAALLVILPKLQVAFAGLAGGISLATAGLSVALAAIVYFRKEIAEGLLATLAGSVKVFEDFTGWSAKMAEKVGLDGLAGKLYDASFSAGEFRRELDAGVTQLMLEQMELGNTAGLLKAQADAREKAAQKAKDQIAPMDAQAKKLKEVTDGFMKLLRPADQLNEKLGLLQGKFSDSQIISVYGKEIVDAAAAQRDHGIAVSGVTARLEEQALAFDRLAASMNFVRKIQEESVRKPIDLGFDVSLPNLNDIPLHVDGLTGALQSFTPAAHAASANTEELFDRMNKARSASAGLAGSIRELNHMGATNSQIIAMLGDQLDGAAADAKRFGLQLDPATAQLLKQMQATKSAAESAKQWREAWSHAMGNVVSEFSKAVTDLIFHSKSLVSSLKGIFLSLAESVTRIFTNDLFLKIGKGLSGILLGTGGKAATTAAGDLGGLVLAGGGLAAAGGAAAGAGATGMGGLVLAGGSTGGGLGASIGAFATNPITIAVAGAIAAGLAINHFAGQGRKTANEFVQGVENPFGEGLSGISAGIQASLRAGTATADSLKSAQRALADLVGKFESASAKFAQQGSREQLVVAQSKSHFEELFGPGFSKLFTDVSSSIAGLKAGTTSGAGIPQTGLAQSASRIFADAAKLFSDGVKALVPGLKDKEESARTVNVTIQAPITNNLEFNVVSVDRESIRNDIAPELTEMVRNNSRGILQDWAKLIRDAGDGLVNVEI